MKYRRAVERIISSIGGTDNILKIKKDNNNIIIDVWDDEIILLDDLKEIDLLKEVSFDNMKLYLKPRFRDINYTFNAFKELPDSIVTVIPPPEEEINDRPFLERLKGTMMGDILPLILALMFGGYLIGIITFIKNFFG